MSRSVSHAVIGPIVCLACCGLPLPTPAFARQSLLAGDIVWHSDSHLLEHFDPSAAPHERPRGAGNPVDTPTNLLALQRTGPVVTRHDQHVVDLGPGYLLLEGQRSSRLHPLPFADTSLHDSFSQWGGSAALVEPIGPSDDISIGLSDAHGKIRSAFTPQYAVPFRTDTRKATLSWLHGEHLSVGASYAITSASGIDTPLALAAARAAGAEAIGKRAGIDIGYRQSLGPASDRSLLLQIGLFNGNRDDRVFVGEAHETGVRARLSFKF